MKFWGLFPAFISINHQLKSYSKVKNLYNYEFNLTVPNHFPKEELIQIKLKKSPLYQIDFIHIKRCPSVDNNLVFDVKIQIKPDNWDFDLHSIPLGTFEFSHSEQSIKSKPLFLQKP